MRDRWFHPTLLHTSQGPPRRASWLELFFDLLFIACAIHVGEASAEHLSARGPTESFLWFLVFFTPMWIIWSSFTFFSNRFDVDDILHRLLVFAQLISVAGMAITAPPALAPGGDPHVFTLTFLVAQLIAALFFARSWRHTPEARPYSAFWLRVFLASTAVWVLSLFVATPLNYVLWVVGVGIVLSTPFSSPSRELLSRFPLDQAHLSERFGLVILVTLGESLFDILGLLGTQPATDVWFFARGLYVLAILTGVWWIYFDDVAGTKLREGPVRFLIWQYAHWPMAASLIGTGVALQHMLTVEAVQQVPADLRWLLAGSLAGVFAMVAAIDSVSERRQTDLSDAWRVRARYAFSVVLLLLAAGGARLSPDAFMASCAAICVVQVLIDMTMAPRSDVDRHLGAATTADLARSRVEEERSSSRRSLNDPIRKGAPPELRQDLYFWFMQGSWTRLLSLLMGGYLALNVVFAGLFMVMDGTIRGADAGSFRDAFSFSVQTFSTIGYGAMSPANAYGDVLVAIEAAVGLLAVALATGLVFAKAARPESKVLFSRPFCITTWNGKKTLMFRAGNARGNEVVDAQITVSILQDELSPEGHHFRRLYDLELTRSRSPIFRLTWTVMHVIDEDSPLAQVDWSAPGEHFLGMIVTIVGHDATYGQTVHARHYYEPSDARADHVFVDMLLGTNDGRLLVDYDLMHQTRPVEPAVTP